MQFDGQLLLYYLFIMLLQYQYTLWGQLAAKEAGGKEGGMTITIAVSQIAVCAAYACMLWVVGYNPVTLFGLEAPKRQPLPKLSAADLLGMGVLSFCYAAAHSAGHYSLTIGHFAFAQIVKAAEPAFAIVVSTFIYNKRPSLARWCCVPIIIAGVIVSTLKVGATGGYLIDFDVTVLFAGSMCNVFAAFRGCAAERIMRRPGLRDRLGSTSNQFAVTNVMTFLLSVPLVVAVEGAQWPKFVSLVSTNGPFRHYLLMSGLFLYVYNELTTLTISKTSAVSASVANTAKRAFIIVGVALAMGKTLRHEELVGATITISAVMVYSMIDALLASSATAPKVKAA